MSVRRRLHLSGPGLQFLTTTITDWIPLFRQRYLAEAMLAQFVETLAHFEVSCIACCLMPSHLHAVLGFRDVATAPKFMQSLKILSAKRLKPLIPPNLEPSFVKGGRYRLWKPRYDEFTIFSEEQFRIKLDYIHNNPVKGELVSDPSKWPYSSAGDGLTGRPGYVPIDKDLSYLR